jgi:predicted glycoside hydrolase/deacetylase ChbG (UPF0249 family)
MIKLIITADDFGMSRIFNEKILELLKNGFITSTNLMVKRVTEDQKHQLIRLTKLFNSKKISVGLHCELDEKNKIEPQILKQYHSFYSLMGFYPTHLDIHKEPTLETIKILNNFAEKLNLPVRNMGIKANTKQTINQAFVTKLYIVNEMVNFLNNMNDEESYELVIHPGEYDPNCKSSLNEEREKDYENIIKIQELINTHKNIKKISYADL